MQWRKRWNDDRSLGRNATKANFLLYRLLFRRWKWGGKQPPHLQNTQAIVFEATRRATRNESLGFMAGYSAHLSHCSLRLWSQ